VSSNTHIGANIFLPLGAKIFLPLVGEELKVGGLLAFLVFYF